MKFVIISLYQAFPPTFGAGTVTYNLFKNLPNCTLIQLGDKDYNEKGIVTVKDTSTSRKEKFINMYRNIKKISEVVKKINPDYIIFEGASWSLYYLILFPKVKKLNNKIIYHDHNVEFELRKDKENKIIYLITKYCEKRILKKSDFGFGVSERDARILKRLSHKEIGVLRNGVDTSFFEKKNDREKLEFKIGKKNLLFMGSYSYKPNKEAIDFLLDKVMPKMSKDVKLVVTGGNVPKENSSLINPGVISINQLRAVIHKSDICVFPIFSGSGTRLKILESLASGKPIISTSKGVEGLDLIPGKDIIIENNLDKFAEKTNWLLKNKKIQQKISKNGLVAVKKYDWGYITKDFLKSLRINKEEQFNE